MSAEDTPRRRRVLLDEMLPRLLARELPAHDVITVADAGWRGVLSGEFAAAGGGCGLAERLNFHELRGYPEVQCPCACERNQSG